MYYLYFLQSLETPKYYIGITNNIRFRWASHKSAAKTGRKSPLYDAMRKYSFYIVQVAEVVSWKEAQKLEIFYIDQARQQGRKILNLADGGEGGNNIPPEKKEEWRAKLSKARKGKKPALGIKHTEENKKLFGEYGKKRWDIYGRYPKDITNYSFKEAKEKYGISKTHYYRLLKRAKSNDLS